MAQETPTLGATANGAEIEVGTAGFPGEIAASSGAKKSTDAEAEEGGFYRQRIFGGGVGRRGHSEVTISYFGRSVKYPRECLESSTFSKS